MKRLVVLLTLLVSNSALRGDNWPGWRGPGNRGVSAEKVLPTVWSSNDNVRWKIRLDGAGVSAPVVWGERIFLTASTGRLNDNLHVYCFHRDDGRRLWHSRLFGSAPTDLYPPGGMAVPTPALAASLYARFYSRQEGDYAARVLAALRNQFGGHAVKKVEET